MHVLLLSPKTTAEPTSYIIHSTTSVSKKPCRVRGERQRREEVGGNLDRSHTDPPTGVKTEALELASHVRRHKLALLKR